MPQLRAVDLLTNSSLLLCVALYVYKRMTLFDISPILMCLAFLEQSQVILLITDILGDFNPA